MKKQQGFVLNSLVMVLVFAFVVGSWIGNAVKLANCDFEPNYKCEVLHGVGFIILPLSMVTVWFDAD